MPRFSYCPNVSCKNHHLQEVERNWYVKKGFHNTKISGEKQRYQCKSCGRTFSSRTFSLDYYTKRKINYRRLLQQQITASGIRDMARHFNCSTNTIQNRLRRLSRQIWAITSLYGEERVLNENLAADGLESFVNSQFFPNNINVLVGSNSQFIFDYNCYYFRRKGKVSEKQRKIKEILYETAQFEKGGASRSFSELLNQLCALWGRSKLSCLILDTDENPIYKTCIKKNNTLKDLRKKQLFSHRLTNSRVERNYQNKLFPCNYIDRQIRKDMAEHVRETVQFSKELNNSMERFNIYVFWHNYIKPFRINGRKFRDMTHAESSGIAKVTIEKIIQGVFSGQRVPFEMIKENLSPFQKRCWDRQNLSPV